MPLLTLHAYSDGGARGNPGPAAIGVVLCDEHGRVVQEASQLIGTRTNNQAEYEAMFLAMELAHRRKARRLRCHADSELVVYQLSGTYRIKNAQLRTLADRVKNSAGRFELVTYRQVPRTHPFIARADRLLNRALDRACLSGLPAGRQGRQVHAVAPAHPRENRQGELFQ